MVIDWAVEKGIMSTATALDQILKTIEEVGELAGGISKGNVDKQIDAIGDVWVTMIIINAMQGFAVQPMEFETFDVTDLDPKSWMAALSLEVSHYAGILAGLAPSKDAVTMRKYITHILSVLATLCEALGHDMQACLDYAYAIISKRDGAMRDGVFVKAGD